MPVAGVGDYQGKGDDIVGDGEQEVAQALTDLGESMALQVQLYRLHAMAERPTGILLLGAQGHDDVLRGQGLQIPADGAQATVEDAEGQVLSGQQPTLMEGLMGHALNLPLTQGGHTIGAV